MLKCFNDDDDYFFFLLLLLFRGFSSAANAQQEKISHPESKIIYIRSRGKLIFSPLIIVSDRIDFFVCACFLRSLFFYSSFSPSFRCACEKRMFDQDAEKSLRYE